MNAQIVVRVEGRDVAEILESVETLDALDLEEHVERIKRRAGTGMMESSPYSTPVRTSRRERFCCKSFGPNNVAISHWVRSLFWKPEIFERVNSPRRKRPAKERIWLTVLREQAVLERFSGAWRSRV